MSSNREPSAIDVVKFYRGKLEGDNPPKRFTIATTDFEILAKAAEELQELDELADMHIPGEYDPDEEPCF